MDIARVLQAPLSKPLVLGAMTGGAIAAALVSIGILSTTSLLSAALNCTAAVALALALGGAIEAIAQIFLIQPIEGEDSTPPTPTLPTTSHGASASTPADSPASPTPTSSARAASATADDGFSPTAWVKRIQNFLKQVELSTKGIEEGREAYKKITHSQKAPVLLESRLGAEFPFFSYELLGAAYNVSVRIAEGTTGALDFYLVTTANDQVRIATLSDQIIEDYESFRTRLNRLICSSAELQKVVDHLNNK